MDRVLPQSATSCFSGATAAAWGFVRAGRIRRAVGELTAVGRRDISPLERAEHDVLQVTCRLAFGDLTGATEAAAGLAARRSGADVAATLARLALGELAAAQGDHERAFTLFHSVAKLPAADDPALPLWRSGAALALLQTGRRSEATALAAKQAAAAEALGDAHTIALSLRTLATTSADPLPVLRRALDLARDTGDLRLIAQIAADLGGLLLLLPGGDPAAAVTLLRGAEQYAAGETLWPLHGRVVRMLERAGEQALPLEGRALTLLTNAEQRVARLAAGGLTNREIAETLGVSVKGVEWHLSRVYRKLGVDGRDDLPALLDVQSA